MRNNKTFNNYSSDIILVNSFDVISTTSMMDNWSDAVLSSRLFDIQLKNEMLANDAKSIVSDEAIILDSCDTLPKQKKHQLSENELLQGELFGYAFEIACYSVRSTAKVYKYSGRSAEKLYDVSSKEFNWIKEKIFSSSGYSQSNNYCIAHEIYARFNPQHKIDYVNDYSFVCRAFSWRDLRKNTIVSEKIDYICALQDMPFLPDKETELFIHRAHFNGHKDNYLWRTALKEDNWFVFHSNERFLKL